MCLLSCMSAHVKTRTHARIHVRRENNNLILKIKDSSSEMAQHVRRRELIPTGCPMNSGGLILFIPNY